MPSIKNPIPNLSTRAAQAYPWYTLTNQHDDSAAAFNASSSTPMAAAASSCGMLRLQTQASRPEAALCFGSFSYCSGLAVNAAAHSTAQLSQKITNQPPNPACLTRYDHTHESIYVDATHDHTLESPKIDAIRLLLSSSCRVQRTALPVRMSKVCLRLPETRICTAAGARSHSTQTGRLVYTHHDKEWMPRNTLPPLQPKTCTPLAGKLPVSDQTAR